ncbi:hypothetical protein ACIPVB_02445 [Microbacterium sp. NPDC090007]|uniref:hypothetical protein n=1 Tax=Microbacterium sp. NPDC090007 TaxID=3364204 RepID=UPI00380D6840
MKKRTISLAAAVLSVGIVASGTVAANAITYGAKNCNWPQHAFVEATTKGGSPMFEIWAGNGTYTSRTFSGQSNYVRNYLNSADEDAQKGAVNHYSQMQSGGMGCSV